MDLEKSNPSVKGIRPKVLFFDVNETLLDLSSVKEEVGKALGGRESCYPYGLQLCYNMLWWYLQVANINHLDILVPQRYKW